MSIRILVEQKRYGAARENLGQRERILALAFLHRERLAGEYILKAAMPDLFRKQNSSVAPNISNRGGVRVTELEKESARQRDDRAAVPSAGERYHVIGSASVSSQRN